MEWRYPMKKQNTLRRLLALLCCTAMLLPCVPATLAAGTAFVDEGFESFADDAALAATWKKGQSKQVDTPKLGKDKAFSGKQSLLVEDTTDGNAFWVKNNPTLPVDAGTEIILSAMYFVEEYQKSSTPYLNLYVEGDHKAQTYSTGKWDPLSIIVTTVTDNQGAGILLGSNTATISKTYWDDVKLQVLTEELALKYVDETLFIPKQVGLIDGLKTKALGLKGVDGDIYGTDLKKARDAKGSALTKAEIQACIDKVNGGDIAVGGPIIDENFESYADVDALLTVWKKGQSAQVDKPQLGTDKAYSGKQSLLVEDTSNKAFWAKNNPVIPMPAGTELILSAWYYVEENNGSSTPYLNLYTGGNNSLYTYSTGKWDKLSTIAATTEAAQSVGVLLGSNAAPVSKTYWDDVKLQVLTEDLAVAYVDEKLGISNSTSADAVLSALKTKAMGLSGVDDSAKGAYFSALKEAREKKGAPLTKTEIQTCVADVNVDKLASQLEGGTLSVGIKGDISAAVVELPGGITAKWASVSPANKNITLSNGKATATAIPTGADDVYKAVLRLSTANKSKDVNYTIRLVNEAGFNTQEVDKAKAELVADTVIGATKTGTIPAPKIQTSGVNVAWGSVKSDPAGFVSVSNDQLTVKSIPTGLGHYEAIVGLKLTKGNAVAEVDYTIVAYNDTYQILLDLPNTSLEVAGEDGVPAGWTSVAANTSSSYIEISDKQAHTGQRSVRIVDNDAETTTAGIRAAGASVPAAKSGYEYGASFWVKGTATSSDPTRAGVATYVEGFNSSRSRKYGNPGPVVAPSTSEWKQVSAWDKIDYPFVGAMAYSFVSTLADVYVDDFLLWERTAEGSALATDELLTGKGDADALYTRLGIASLGVTGLNDAYKADYLSTLTAKRAAKGSPLTAAELAAGVTQVNDTVTATTTAVLQKLVAKISTAVTVSKIDTIDLPAVDDSSVSVKYTSVSGTGASRIRLTGLGAKVESLPAYGSKDETAMLVLTLAKGSAKVDVNIKVTLKAYSKNVTDMFYAAQMLKLSDYLNGQSANCVTADLKALPTSMSGGISIKWQVLDSATLQPSKALTAQGKVTRPAYGEADAAVILRATLSKGSEQFVQDLRVIVAAEGAEEARTVITNNPSFEGKIPADKFTAPDGWVRTLKWEDGPNELLSSYATISTGITYTGAQALRITANGMKAQVQNSIVTTAREGYTYTLQTMVYTDSAEAAPSVTLRFWDNSGLKLGSYTTTYAAAPGELGAWKNLSVSGVAPASTVMITAELDGGTQVGESYFDDVRLREWPIVANGRFDLGATGWTTAGKVSGGKLTLTANQTAVSKVRGADRGVTYYLSLDADGGKAALRFVDKSGKTLAEYEKDMKSGLNAFFAYAPANTAGVQVVLTGAMTADNVKITRSTTGLDVVDGDFEISAKAGVGTPWDLTNATIGANTGKDGTAGLTVNAGGKASSVIIPVEEGKKYMFSADVKGKGGKMDINLHVITGKLLNQRSVASEQDGWTTITYTFEAIPEAVDRNHTDHCYAQIVLSGAAVFDNVNVYGVSKNVTNASMEDIKNTAYGTLPFNWTGYGTAATYMANQDGQFTLGVKGLAVELFGLGEGGVRSSFLKDIKSGKAYEATINAKGSGAKLIIEFWDQNRNKLGSESVTIDSAQFKGYSVIGTAPSGTIYATLAVGGDGTGLVYADEAAIVPVVRSIGNNIQTFMDNWLIADSSNVKRTFYEGQKQGKTALKGVAGAYETVVWDAKEQIFKMWNQDGGKYLVRMYTSKDGINWAGPFNCYDTKTGEQVISGSAVVIDEDEPDPNKRYKAIILNNVKNRDEATYNYATSPDGIYWTVEEEGPHGRDVHSLAYDPYNDEYILTYKQSTRSPDNVEDKRVHRVAVSKDLINWSPAVRQYTVDSPEDGIMENNIRTDGYGNGVYALGDSYVSLNWRLLLQDSDSYDGELDNNLLFSRDLTEDWQRLYHENGDLVLGIPRGADGTWDDDQIFSGYNAINVGNETWWYYLGITGDHSNGDGSPRTGAMSFVKWRLNGFASMDFSANGTLTTEQFTLMGTELHLNAVGSLTVELLDASGAVAAIGKFSGDSVDGAVTWDKSIASQAGKVVSLRFTGADAKLYTIQVCGSIFSDVSADAWYYRAAHYAADNGIMAGTGNGTFSPNSTLTRAMIIQMLYNKVGQPKISDKHGFSDVPADQWFNNAVTWGTKNGVMAGYGGGKFGPNDNVTIEQIAVILWNYSGNPEFDAELTDVGKYDGWAKNALTWAVDNGVLHGVNFKNATDNATRAQAAQMLTNYLRW